LVFSFFEFVKFSVSLVLVDSCEFEGCVEVTSSLEEFVLEFNPVKSQRVEEALEHVHHHKHSECHGDEGEEDDERLEGDREYTGGSGTLDSPCGGKALSQEYFS